MGLQKKAEKWVQALGLPRDPCFWANGDSAPLKELFAKLLSVEALKNTDELNIEDPVPFEKLLAIAQSKLGVHSILVGADLAGNDAKLKVGLFGTVIFLKSALKDFSPEWVSALPTPDFGIAGGAYSNEPICLKCNKEVLFVERVIVGERVWHRRCMHCHLCGKRLFLGTFRLENGKLECFEHFLNKELGGNELQSFENTNTAKPPPPRPPPPRRSTVSTPSPNPDASLNASTTGTPLRANTPQKTPEPNRRTSLQVTIQSPAVNKRLSVANTPASDQSNDSNWEVVEYPEQLNPFADEDEMSDCLNPFGYTSSEDESEDEHPVPAPRKSIESAIEEAINDDSSRKTSKEEQIEPKPEPVKPQEPVPKPKEPEPVPEVEEVKQEDIKIYPNIPVVNTAPLQNNLQNFYLPASIVLTRKRIDSFQYQRPELQHELEKVIKTLDYIERHTAMLERNLIKDLGKEGFKWDKSNFVDDWGRAMQQRHDNFIKGSMLVHEYLQQLTNAALEKIKKLEQSKVDKSSLKKELTEMQERLFKNKNCLPLLIDENSKKENITPKPPKDEKRKSKGLVKRIKKVF
ncbi:unnamed protein product [Bursaphelenchus okinawaensis]|uniref:LIM zinc-binding domain-containing protein n=1 Tax=Bursaphelenchus okinawaensis TaxID=465554 RepID=A0A811KMU1_9BILA|nr:unnamed protein product [Bursaphelenchus okinawaensis]CAG9107933.1 unnamed protein product [Bursaphelenchus okinawaensis]